MPKIYTVNPPGVGIYEGTASDADPAIPSIRWNILDFAIWRGCLLRLHVDNGLVLRDRRDIQVLIVMTVARD
jgi:hypothetical protein